MVRVIKGGHSHSHSSVRPKEKLSDDEDEDDDKNVKLTSKFNNFYISLMCNKIKFMFNLISYFLN